MDECLTLDVNNLHKAGCLYSGWSGRRQWYRNGEKIAAINLQSDGGRLILSYRVSRFGGEPERVVETVEIVRVACRFGGVRPYFICPGVSCRRRVAKLHAAGRHFLCRHCYCLAYQSQREGVRDRAVRRERKIRQRLGGEPDFYASFPDRPKGLWGKTYDRLCEQLCEAEERADDAFSIGAEELMEMMRSENEHVSHKAAVAILDRSLGRGKTSLTSL